MINRWMRALAGAAMLVVTSSAQAQEPAKRPLPYPVFEPAAFKRAVERGTRTRTGQPGAKYWTQKAQYRIEAALDTAAKRISGTETVRYFNRSPDTLRTMVVFLYQNVYRGSSLKNRVLPVTDGLTLTRLAIGGQELQRITSRAQTQGYTIDGTVMRVSLPAPIVPGGSVELEASWNYAVPPNGSPRNGTDTTTYMIAYWYPQISVYDDVIGWFTDPYMTNAEFYADYADFDVSITVPNGFLVGATGTLENANAVLGAEQQRRLEQARHTRTRVPIVAAEERGAGRATSGGSAGSNTWRFKASNVRDFAWAASGAYVWDASAAATGTDTVLVHAFYRPQSQVWREETRYLQHSIEFLSRFLWSYPYPHMTGIDGPSSCGGMEYPMMTCLGGLPEDANVLYSVTLHETGHMWFPMMVGSNERRHMWMDEGLTQYNEYQGVKDFIKRDDEIGGMDDWMDLARAEGEVDLMRFSDQVPPRNTSRAHGVAAYSKPAALLRALRAILGEETFLRAYREYGRRWTNKHPTPYDFFNTFEDVAGRDLDWFWTPWFFETWTMDQAVGSVTREGANTRITIFDRGLAPMPVLLEITFANGKTERRTIPVDVWLTGARETSITVAGAVSRVTIDQEELLPDIDRSNNVK
jgi:hypothetical protein